MNTDERNYLMHEIFIDRDQGEPIIFYMKPGDVVLLAGPNGVGKSALLSEIYRFKRSTPVTYLPGHRQVFFNRGVELFQHDPRIFSDQLRNNPHVFGRTKNEWAEDHFKATLRKFDRAESIHNSKIIELALEAERAKEVLSQQASPLSRLNAIFAFTQLPIRFLFTERGLQAERQGVIYDIDALSDGERAALFLSAEIIIQPPDSLLLVDEPEKHLHPSIAGMLLQAALRTNSKISTILCSHDPHLLEKLPVTNIVHIRNSKTTSTQPETRVYSAELLGVSASENEELRRDILGARSNILFVEGLETSYDIAIYSHVYEGVKVVPKGGRLDVTNSVKALRSFSSAHWLQPSGLIDGDWWDETEKSAFRKDGILVLPFPSVENLFFLEEAVECFVEAQLSFRGGPDLQCRLAALEIETAKVLDDSFDDIVAGRAARLLDKALSEAKLSSRKLKDRSYSDVAIQVSAIHKRAQDEIALVREQCERSTILQKLPIKRTHVPDRASKSLGSESFKDYCKVILAQIESNSPSSQKLMMRLRETLPEIPGVQLKPLLPD